MLSVSLASFAPYGLWLLRTWRTLDLEHTLTRLLCLPVAAGLAWLARARWLVAPAPDRRGWLLVAAALGLHAAGLAVGLPVLSGLALPPLLVGAAAVTRGPATARHLVLPAAFLVFLLPLPWLLQPTCALPSQRASAAVAYALLLPTGLDVMLSGVTVYTPEFYVRVDDTCSGLHSVASLLMLGVVAAHLFPMSGRRQALVLALVLPLGLLANALRIASLVPVGLVAGRGAAAGLWHDLSAVACFALAYAALFAFARRLARSAAAAQSPTSSAQTDHEKASPAS